VLCVATKAFRSSVARSPVSLTTRRVDQSPIVDFILPDLNRFCIEAPTSVSPSTRAFLDRTNRGAVFRCTSFDKSNAGTRRSDV
jgi:hypothetical protein